MNRLINVGVAYPSEALTGGMLAIYMQVVASWAFKFRDASLERCLKFYPDCALIDNVPVVLEGWALTDYGMSEGLRLFAEAQLT
jgi:hypothetical protein